MCGCCCVKSKKSENLSSSLFGPVLQCLDPQDGNLAQSSIPVEDCEQNLKTLAD